MHWRALRDGTAASLMREEKEKESEEERKRRRGEEREKEIIYLGEKRKIKEKGNTI
jgi:hypothetical protein